MAHRSGENPQPRAITETPAAETISARGANKIRRIVKSRAPFILPRLARARAREDNPLSKINPRADDARQLRACAEITDEIQASGDIEETRFERGRQGRGVNR